MYPGSKKPGIYPHQVAADTMKVKIQTKAHMMRVRKRNRSASDFLQSMWFSKRSRIKSERKTDKTTWSRMKTIGWAATFCSNVQESNQVGPVWWKNRLKQRAPQARTRKVTEIAHRWTRVLAPTSWQLWPARHWNSHYHSILIPCHSYPYFSEALFPHSPGLKLETCWLVATQLPPTLGAW